ncbi:MAG: lysophospholipid acyltransferase family protein [Sphingomicrobium sp.]
MLARLFGRSPWPRRFLAGCAAFCGVDVRVEGELAGPHSLLLANHTSWLDIPVLASATGCAFVSKAELRRNPVMKWLADQNRTLYIDRSDRRGLHEQTAAVRTALGGDQPLALFPEATVSSGGRLLPFKPALLTAVAPPPPGCAIQPAAIDYGPAMRSLGWAPSEHGVANAIRILGRKGRMTATVRLLEPLEPTLGRKPMAKAAHDAIAEALAPSGIAPAGL